MVLMQFSVCVIKTVNMRQQLSWIEQHPSKLQARGSSPFWRANKSLSEAAKQTNRSRHQITYNCDIYLESTLNGEWFKYAER